VLFQVTTDKNEKKKFGILGDSQVPIITIKAPTSNFRVKVYGPTQELLGK